MLLTAFISKKYFNKSGTWLYQRVYGHTVNRKQAKLNDQQLKKLNLAIQDVSRHIGSSSV
ncbi:DUF5053 domain-containing protein [Niabella hirudinis]|uniref:DUF5053 domain-containing protein n=1 Tax=Niabella hirudinis TaxID=1285929 RepID=UPI003EC0D754